MRLLWIPHTPTSGHGWEGSRPYHLIRRLAARHDVHWITWTQRVDVARWGGWAASRAAAGTEHQVALAPNFYRLIERGYPRPWHVALNQRLFGQAVARIVRHVRPHVVVCSASHHWTGFPRVDASIPVVFDYVDKSPEWVEAEYVRTAAAVVAVSEPLAAAAAARGRPAVLIPNGVDAAPYLAWNRSKARAKLGLGPDPVVSLIGLTCSPRLYFLVALAELQGDHPNLCFLVVGGGSMRETILRHARRLGLRHVVAPGAVAHAEVPIYFAASDVGLYPGEDDGYYRDALPLKILEYAAAGCRVVSSPVERFRHGWPGVHVVQPSADAFRDAIRAALDGPTPGVNNLLEYDWDHLVRRFESVLERVCLHDAT